AGRLASLLTGLAEIDLRAPMRIDGELVRTDRAGVNWRELHAAPREVVVKTATEPLLMSVERFTGVSQ
ncbi:MAG: phosphoribosyl-dephospho-CoA transferase, partial [Paraburkholderia sp.]|nr:phosphoribosyl-dephospho-CoA transferase [Paraburkholderia sp.]